MPSPHTLPDHGKPSTTHLCRLWEAPIYMPRRSNTRAKSGAPPCRKSEAMAIGMLIGEIAPRRA